MKEPSGRARSGAPVLVSVGAVLRGDRFLVVRRGGTGPLAGSWEFPGGKIEPGESAEVALRREVLEESGISFREAVLVEVREHRYPHDTVRIHFFLCLEPDVPAALPAEREAAWVTVQELGSLQMPPANRRFVELLAEQYG